MNYYNITMAWTLQDPYSIPFPYLSDPSIIELLPLHRLVFLHNFGSRSGCLSNPQIMTTPESQ
jgi:hypothetical protein